MPYMKATMGTIEQKSDGHESTPATRKRSARTSSVTRLIPVPNESGLAGGEETARASVRAARRSFVTVLFTDIVGSTQRAVDLGDHQWLDLQAAYQAMATEAVGRFRGRVQRTMGDGMLATFSSAIAAAMCAARISEASASFGLQVRAGLHAGECERRGRSLGGLVFNIGARIADLADGNEVLVSQTVKDLVIGSDLEFETHGWQELDGLPGGWEVYELTSREGRAR